MSQITKFYVNFTDPAMLDNDDDEEFHGYHNEIAINCTEGQYNDILEDNDQMIDDIETTYGVLDIEGDNHSMGFSSYEIEMKDADMIFQKLCNMFTKYRQ